MSHDILGLMEMYMYGMDDYGKKIVPPLPLSFDRVNEGRSPLSTAPLFQLPFEILGSILEHVSPASLASLALVSHDCRQLARSRQFASVLLDYSDSSFGLISLLQRERQQRAVNEGLTVSPSLGACVRRMTVATHPDCMSLRHDITLDEEFADLGKEVREERIAKAARMYDVYLECIENILSDGISLPNLELLDWEDKIALPPSFFNALASSSIQHLKLFRVSIEEEFTIVPPGTLGTRGWPLRSLHLEILPGIPRSGKFGTSTICNSILRLCASTLESLTWQSFGEGDPQSFVTDLLDPPRFPELRNLKLLYIQPLDSSILEAFLQDGLHALEITPEPTSTALDFFQKGRSVSSLKTLIWCSIAHFPANQVLEFLKANTQLSKLSLPSNVPTVFAEMQLLPLLSRSFVGLTSLHLAIDDTTLSGLILETIGTLVSLGQIRLRAGEQSDWRFNWLIDHELIRSQLRGLPSLRKVAFSRDTYRSMFPGSGVDVDCYYPNRLLGPGEGFREDLSGNNTVWEQRHRERMLVEGNKYISEMPKLEWLHFGQITMLVTLLSNTNKKTAVCLSEERDKCGNLLWEMFGSAELGF